MAKRTKPYLQHASFRPDVEVDYDSYPFSIPAVRELGNIDFHPNVTFFVGENGSGKSPALEGLAVALGFGTEGGTKNVQFKTADSVSPLHDVLLNKLRGDGNYLLGEPDAALSPSRQLAALRAIHHLVEDSSQFVIATHSPILLSYPHSKIIQFDSSGVSEAAFEDTEHFCITRDFLNNYPRRMEQLLADDTED